MLLVEVVIVHVMLILMVMVVVDALMDCVVSDDVLVGELCRLGVVVL